MITNYDKAIAAGLWAVVIILQRVFKIELGLDQDTVTIIAAALSPLIVFFVPNKPK